MDITKQKELSDLATKQIELAQEYKDARVKAVDAKVKLNLLLVAHLKEIRKEKKSVGMEMAVLMLLEREQEAKKFYHAYEYFTYTYKGLEKLIEAHQNKISAIQSEMKYVLKGEQYG